MPSADIALASSRPALPEKLNYARALAESGLLPAAFRKQPANVLFAVEYGDMLGLSPMAAIQGIHVIDGKPTASAALMSALVRVKGHKLRVVFDKATTSAYAELTRSDDPGFTFRVDWNLDRAVTAGLCTVKDGKAHARDYKDRPTPWEKYTPNMLKARCISEVCRDGAEECLMGMHYTPEELGADVDDEGDPIQAVAERVEEALSADAVINEPRETTTGRDWTAEIKQAESASDLPALTKLWNEAAALPKGQAPPSNWITDAASRVKRQKQMAKIFVLLDEGGIPSGDAGKPRRLALAARLLGREPFGTYADLSDAEVVKLSDLLAGLQKAGTLIAECTEVSTVVDEILSVRNEADAAVVMGRVAVRSDLDVDVAHLLTGEDREALGLRDDEPVELLALAEKVVGYSEKHGSGPRALAGAVA